MNRSALSVLAIVFASLNLTALSPSVRSQQPTSSPSPQPSSAPASPRPMASPTPPSRPVPKQSPAASTSAQPKIVNSVHYTCDGGKGFKAVFLSNQTVKTTFGSKTLTLPQVESGSGFRYSDGSVTLRGKGREAFVEVGDKVLFDRCVAGSSVKALW